jgi:hypothetical protein
MARALLSAEQAIDDFAGRRKLIHHRLGPQGRLTAR